MYNLLRLVLHSTMTTQQVTNLIALITQRLERRAQDRASVLFTEPTEEIRAQWLDVLMPLLTCENTVRPDAVQVEKWLDVIQLAIGDPSPEVQKKGAYMLKSLAMKAPKEIALTGDRPMQFCILPLLYHKHAPVRTLGLQAAKQVGKSIPSSVPVLFRFDKVANRQAAFPLLVHDTSLMVRSTLIQVAASYLKECGPRPRYDNAPYVVPILLGCTADDVQSIADDAKKVIDEVAEAFAGDMLAAGLWDEVSAVNEESRDKIRRVAGLQHAVHQCYRECLKELLNETNELNRDRRIRALGVLESLIGYATEEDVMGSCERILDTLFNVLVNGFDESSVVVKVTLDVFEDG
ncbi:armadillo-type protein [Dichotomocladium elegans]|nr:armadillo-type protein [Dichotomocladium elegans]